MKAETRKWIGKAEGDWRVASREVKSRRPVWHVVCFLAQQSAEKYLKALLDENGVPFRKTHDLVLLAETAGPIMPDLQLLSPQLARLTTFAVAARYPGTDADSRAGKEAVSTAGVERARVRSRLRA